LSSSRPTVSVVIRARNECANLRRTLGALTRQSLPDEGSLEIIVVDNDSTDGSADLARERGARVVPISRREFTWGRALNRGIREARGGIVMILSADASPVDRSWAALMAAPFADPDVAAVYGRQVPRPDAPIDEYARLRVQFPAERADFVGQAEGSALAGPAMPFSNACAAVRRRVWQSIPFDEELPGAEDRVWAYAVLEAGFALVYESRAQVAHSHRDTVLRHAWRHWELFCKNRALDGRAIGPASVLRLMAAHVKRRCLNCLAVPEAPLLPRVEGLARLPFEVAALAAVSLLSAVDRPSAGLRYLFWR